MNSSIKSQSVFSIFLSHETNTSYLSCFVGKPKIQEKGSILGLKSSILWAKMNEAAGGWPKQLKANIFQLSRSVPPFFIYLSEQIWKQMALNFKGFECSLSFTFWELIVRFYIFSLSSVQMLLGIVFHTSLPPMLLFLAVVLGKQGKTVGGW